MSGLLNGYSNDNSNTTSSFYVDNTSSTENNKYEITENNNGDFEILCNDTAIVKLNQTNTIFKNNIKTTGSFISVNNDNTTNDLVFSGFQTKYNINNSIKYSGFYRDPGNGYMYFFKDSSVEPSGNTEPDGYYGDLVCNELQMTGILNLNGNDIEGVKAINTESCYVSGESRSTTHTCDGTSTINNLTVNGTSTLKNTTVNGTLTTTTLNTTGDITVGDDLTVNDALTVNGNSTLKYVSMTSNNTSGSSVVNGSHIVYGSSTLKNVSMTNGYTSGDLVVNGSSTLNSLTVNGTTSFNSLNTVGDINVGDDCYINDDLEVRGTTRCYDGLIVLGSCLLSAGLIVSGNITRTEWNSGDVIFKKVIKNPTPSNSSFNTSSDKEMIGLSYSPKSSNSTITFTYETDYDISLTSTGFTLKLKVNNSTEHFKTFYGDTIRGGSGFPFISCFENVETSTKTISLTCFRTYGSGTLSLIQSSMIIIEEIQN